MPAKPGFHQAVIFSRQAALSAEPSRQAKPRAAAMWVHVTVEPQQGLSASFADRRASLQQYFQRRVAHLWDAQDLVQEVYLRLLRLDRRQAGTVQCPDAYMFTVAANLLKEHAGLKRRAPQGEDVLELWLERLAVPCEAAAEVDRELRRRRLALLIERLSPKCRAALVLHYRDELPYHEVGRQLGISSHMVKKYIVKALAACRQGMASYD